MLFTDAKGGNLCFFNDDLHQEQIQTELEMLDTICDRLRKPAMFAPDSN